MFRKLNIFNKEGTCNPAADGEPSKGSDGCSLVVCFAPDEFGAAHALLPLGASDL